MGPKPPTEDERLAVIADWRDTGKSPMEYIEVNQRCGVSSERLRWMLTVIMNEKASK